MKEILRTTASALRMRRVLRGSTGVLVLFLFAWMLFPAVSLAQGDSDADIVERDISTHIDTLANLLQTAGPYSLSISLSYDDSSGNTNMTSSSAGLNFYKFWDKWGLVADSSAAHSESDSTDAESYDFDFYVTRKFSDNLSLFFVEEWHRDLFKGLDFQNVIGVGVLWKAINKDKWAMTVHGAPAWSREEHTTGQVDKFTVGLLELNSTFTLSSNTRATTALSFYENFDDSADYRFDGNFGISTAINSTFSLNFSYDLEYDHQPVIGSLTTDKTFKASLIIKLAGKSSSGDSSSSGAASSSGDTGSSSP